MQQDKGIYDIIRREICAIVDIIKWKQISDLVATYVIKKVLLRRIEYQMQNIFLTNKQCDAFNSIYFKAFKHIISIAQTALNIILSIFYPYNIKSVKELKQIAHTSGFINCLNNPSTLGRITCICLKQFQINNWIPENILMTQSLGKVDY